MEDANGSEIGHKFAGMQQLPWQKGLAALSWRSGVVSTDPRMLVRIGDRFSELSQFDTRRTRFDPFQAIKFRSRCL